MITTLFDGNKRFVSDVFDRERDYFEKFAKQQRPSVF
jgi:carbonic anhydrase